MADKGLVITLNKKACIFADPAKYPEAAKLANSYFCPLGPEPGVGHVLMMQSDLSAIDTTGDMTLAFDDGTLVKFTKLQFVNAMAVSEGTLTANRVYLVKVADKRLGYKKFAPPLNKAYNVRSYVSLREPTETAKIVAADCYTESLNSGALWTWTTMLQNIWSNGSYGTWPGLPSTPAGYPEGFHFTGESNWEALNGVLDLLDFAVKCDPFTGNLSIVDLTVEQNGLTSAIATIGPTLDSADPYWGAKSYYPTTVAVQYEKQFAMYGNLPDAELTGNVLFGTIQTYNKATSKANANSGKVIKNEQEKYVQEEYGGTVWADRDTEATEKKDRLLLRQAKSESFARIRCQGIVKTVSPGSQVKAVLWRNWGNGTVTEIARFPGFASMRDMLDASIDNTESKIECLKWIDLARQGNTKYPQVMQWVTLDKASSDTLANPNTEGVYTGRIISPNAARNQTTGTLSSNVVWDNIQDCFVIFADSSTDGHPNTSRFLARFAGSIKSEDVTDTTDKVMPLLVAEMPQKRSKPLMGVAKTNWNKNGDYPSKAWAAGTNPTHGGYVYVDNISDGRTTTDEIKVWLPTGPGQDPNVIEGQQVTFQAIEGLTDGDNDDGLLYESIGNHEDDAIGTVKMIFVPSGTASQYLQPGWSFCDGTQNASKTRSGQAYDMTDRFPLGNNYGSVAGDGTLTIDDADICAAIAEHGGVSDGAGGGVAGRVTDGRHLQSGTDIVITDTDYRPKHRGVYFIERIYNGAN